MDSEIRIIIDDETSNGIFGNANVGEKAGNTAVSPKTKSSSQSGGPLKQVSKNAANSISGGKLGQMESYATMVGTMNVTMMASMAFTIAMKLWDKYKDIQKQQREIQDIALRAGGVYRNGNKTNASNSRVHFITGKFMSGQSTIYKR